MDRGKHSKDTPFHTLHCLSPKLHPFCVENDHYNPLFVSTHFHTIFKLKTPLSTRKSLHAGYCTFCGSRPPGFETLGSQFFCTRRCVKLGLQSPSSVGFWSNPKSEFSGTESPDPDPRESQICLLGSLLFHLHSVAFYMATIPNIKGQ